MAFPNSDTTRPEARIIPMSYTVIARRWRPKKFEDVVGQAHIVTTLKNSIKNGRLAHAYLFSGPRGVGKTSISRILAKAVNCLEGVREEPCNACHACKSIDAGGFVDVIEIDAASNRGIDEIRELRETVRYLPMEARYKVYIIDEAHMLTEPAFNALLKTLEEPPGHNIFILATTENQKIPYTIMSRCQRFDFRRISEAHIVEQLKRICRGRGRSSTTRRCSTTWSVKRTAASVTRNRYSIRSSRTAASTSRKRTPST